MSLRKTAFTALGKLVLLGVLLAVFLGGMAGVVYMSLQGEELSVPSITGKSFAESEVELAALGLKIKKRADRVSDDPPNTVVEQLPKAGEIVKTGQVIRVVTTKEPVGGEAAPLPKGITDDSDDSETIKEMISDKPKKKANTAVKKKADTARDVNAAAGSNVAGSNSKSSNSAGSDDKSNKSTTPSTKAGAANTAKPASSAPKTPSTRP